SAWVYTASHDTVIASNLRSGYDPAHPDCHARWLDQSPPATGHHLLARSEPHSQSPTRQPTAAPERHRLPLSGTPRSISWAVDTQDNSARRKSGPIWQWG